MNRAPSGGSIGGCGGDRGGTGVQVSERRRGCTTVRSRASAGHRIGGKRCGRWIRGEHGPASTDVRRARSRQPDRNGREVADGLRTAGCERGSGFDRARAGRRHQRHGHPAASGARRPGRGVDPSGGGSRPIAVGPWDRPAGADEASGSPARDERFGPGDWLRARSRAARLLAAALTRVRPAAAGGSSGDDGGGPGRVRCDWREDTRAGERPRLGAGRDSS